MSYTVLKSYTLYRLEQVQKEIGVNDLMDWSRLISGYELNPVMVTYQGFTGMEETEKDRLVQELKERLANMPEIKASQPAHKMAYGYSKDFSLPFTLYTMEDVYTECNLDGVNNAKQLARIIKDWNPQPKMIEMNGNRGFTEQEKARLVAELEELKSQFEARERQAYLEKLAMQETRILPTALW